MFSSLQWLVNYLKNFNDNSFFLTPTTAKEIEDIIGNLKLGKATGPNSIPTRILKDHKKELSKPLAELITVTHLLILEFFQTCLNLQK